MSEQPPKAVTLTHAELVALGAALSSDMEARGDDPDLGDVLPAEESALKKVRKALGLA
jgi:hypothetical protein